MSSFRAASLRTAALLTIRLYRNYLAQWKLPSCRMTPSCSRYAEDAITTHGLVRGAWLASKRILRCNPLSTTVYDPVPTGVRSTNP